MSLMGTLAKVAIGYATARGIDRLSGNRGATGLFGGASVDEKDAQADHAPGLGNMQEMMAQLGGGAGLGNLQEMMTKMTAASGFDLSSLMGGGAGKGGSKEGLLSSVPKDTGGPAGFGGGAGIAGILAALGGAAAMGGQTTGALVDQFAKQAGSAESDKSAALMLRAMVQAAKADGGIDKTEQARIMDTLGDDAEPEDVAFLRNALDEDVDVDALVRDTPAPMAMQVYSMSLMSIRVDTDAEAKYLDQLASGLGLSQEVVNTLHAQMGVRPLYS